MLSTAKEARGITLIALVVTIVVLLILAGVTITMVLGKDGIIAQAKLAAERVKEEEAKAEEDLNKLAEDIQNWVGGETGGPNPGESGNNLVTDGSFDGKVNTPKLGTGMTAITWDEESSSWVEPTTNAEWYNYDNKQWANAVTEKNGVKSYWVWIPRYAYRITSGYHQSGEDINSEDGTKGAGEIDIKFLQGTGNEDASGSSENIVESLTEIAQTGPEGPSINENEYVVHPAFTNKPENGGWNAELTGIWVAKYEASHSDATATEVGSSEELSVQPSVTSWRYITVSDMYDTCKKYDSTLNSHLMKNSEWGAVAYLAHSKYGLNGNEIGENQCEDYITGAGPGGTSDVYDGSTYSYEADTFEEKYGYKSTQGKKASTTGNEYGIYDLSGGSWEYVSAYLKDCSTSYIDSLKTASTSEPWTVDLYDGTSSTRQENYTANNNKYGDAVWETSSKSERSWDYSWFKNCSFFPNASSLVFVRGGYYPDTSNAGLFYFIYIDGSSYVSSSFRPVLVTL